MAVGTLLGYDGFDHYQQADIDKWWPIRNGAGSSTLGSAYSRNPWGQGLTITNNNVGQQFGANLDHVMVCFGLQMVTASASRTLAMFLDGTTEQISVRTDASSRVIVTRNGTAIGSTGPVLLPGQFYWFEFQAVIANAGSFDLHVNTASVCTGAGVDTSNTANQYATGWQWAPASFTVNVDDAFWFDTSTGTDFIGNQSIYPQLVYGPGPHQDFTANGGTNPGNVRDIYEDGDWTYNHFATVNGMDDFEMQKLPFSAATIIAVQDIVMVRQDTGAQRTVRGIMRDNGGTDRVTGGTLNPTTVYQPLKSIYQLDPATGSAWDVAGVEGSRPGVKITV